MSSDVFRGQISWKARAVLVIVQFFCFQFRKGYIPRILLININLNLNLNLVLQIEITRYGGLGRVEKEERQGEKEENRLASHLQETNLGKKQ